MYDSCLLLTVFYFTFCRFKLFTTNDAGAEVNSKDSGLLHMMLKTDEEAPLFQLEENWNFPVFVSARIMIASHESPVAS